MSGNSSPIPDYLLIHSDAFSMKPRMHFDDVAWEKSTDIYDDWPYTLYEQVAYNDIGVFLREHYRPRQHQEFRPFKTGGFNTSLLMTFTDNSGAVIRFPLPGAVMFPEEKVRNEVSTMRFILDKTRTSDKIPIPVPFISHWGQRTESPSKAGPFIIMDYINHTGTMRDLLQIPSRQPGERPVLNPDLSIARLEALYEKLANMVLSLSTLAFNRIGSPSLDQNDDSTWKVTHRPLSYSMNEIVQLGTLPRSKLPTPTTTYEKASSYFETLAELHISHLINQRNDAVDSEDDCRRKIVGRFLFRKIIRDLELRKKWVSYETGPFPLWCDDFRPENVLVDEAETITGVVDWEFTYTAPVEFTHAPPWWLLLEKPEYWPKGLDDWCMEYEKRLPAFLRAMSNCEDEAIRTGRLTESQRLSIPMRASWESGDFWIMYAARGNFAFDAIYWQKIDQRFFGPTTTCLDPNNAWQERLDVLEPEERQKLEEYVDLKLRQMETRVLAWDPDEHTLEYMAKMNT